MKTIGASLCRSHEMIMRRNSDYLAGLLKELRDLSGETEWVEFKCNNMNPDEIGENISALANSAAIAGKANAYIVWGIADKSHAIEGTDFIPSCAQKGNEALENWLLHLLDPKVHLMFHEFVFNEKQISIIEIPRASHRPVLFKGQEFIRIGSYTKKLKEFPEQERELWRTFDHTPFEGQIALENVSHSEVLKLLDYPVYFSLLDMPLPENRDGILERLARDEMIMRRPGNNWDISNLGAILFAKDLTAFKHLRRKAIRVIIYRSSDRIDAQREFQSECGYASGHENLIAFINSMLPENEVIGQALRKTVLMYPDLAVRELVTNALIHQDFSITGSGPLVEIFPDRMEITNPGEPLVAVERFIDTPPRSRNESLASWLRRAGICEERGSGIDKVVYETEFYQLPAPLFQVVSSHMRVSLFSHKPFSKMNSSDRTRACYLHACLQYVKHDLMTNASLRGRFGIEEKNRAQVSRVISETIDAGLVKPYDPQSGSRKHARYVPFWA